MHKIKELGHEFIVRETRDECLEVWEGEPDRCPSRLLTFAETDGADGLMWADLETFWVEYGVHPGQLDPVRLYNALHSHLVENGIAYTRSVQCQDGTWMVQGEHQDFVVENPEFFRGSSKPQVTFIRRNGKAHIVGLQGDLRKARTVLNLPVERSATALFFG